MYLGELDNAVRPEALILGRHRQRLCMTVTELLAYFRTTPLFGDQPFFPFCFQSYNWIRWILNMFASTLLTFRCNDNPTRLNPASFIPFTNLQAATLMDRCTRDRGKGEGKPERSSELKRRAQTYGAKVESRGDLGQSYKSSMFASFSPGVFNLPVILGLPEWSCVCGHGDSAQVV